MAILMVASFAVIPTSAAINGNVMSTVVNDDWYVYYWRVVDAWCNSTTDAHMCWVSVTDYEQNPYGYDYDEKAANTTAEASTSGYPYLVGIYASGCSWDGDYDYLVG